MIERFPPSVAAPLGCISLIPALDVLTGRTESELSALQAEKLRATQTKAAIAQSLGTVLRRFICSYRRQVK
jgi:hypothetical protein